MKITAKIIQNALASKHWLDVFVPECKTGPSQFRGCPRLDAWVMKKAWAQPLVTGYEIKVNRSDFINDEKWRNYLPYCNEFYFVCPSHLIEKDELPADTGLRWISSTGTRIYTKKKAPYRDVEIPEDLYRYILMGRVDISEREYYFDSKLSIISSQPTEERDFWDSWLKQKESDLSLGKRVSKKLQEIITEKIDKVAKENEKLQFRINHLETIETLIKELGIEPNSSWLIGEFRRKVKELQAVVPKDLEWTMKRLVESLEKFQEELKKVKGE